MKLKIIALSLGLVSQQSLAKSSIITNYSDKVSEVGDWVQIIVPASGFFSALAIEDYDGAWQVTKGVAATSAITHTLKFGFGRFRPDASSPNSFPSGHTSAAFSGAAFIDHRYHNYWAIPAYGAAAFVGFSRVHANKHFMDDVLAGASIATLTSLYFTEPHQGKWQATPAQVGDNPGVNFSYHPDANSNHITKTDFKYSYQLNIGAANNTQNINGISNSIDLSHFNGNENPHTFAAAILNVQTTKAQQLQLEFVPFEGRTYSRLSHANHFLGKEFQGGETLVSAYRLWSLHSDYQFTLARTIDWQLHGGIGLSSQFVQIELDNEPGTKYQNQSVSHFMPNINATSRYQFSERWSIDANTRFSQIDCNKLFEINGQVNYQLSNQWQTGLFFGRYQHTIDRKTFFNKVAYNYGGLKMKYQF
ncbi:phosphatase PAP2 family protein [Paraferrimonas sp. SM1919]|uniref:phosphatase PAP2 family protein n=1 Tax=Paraferrimonas sp. SM1919 TaxID=2662263 RepID=UPI0013D7CB3A|nr:phosphatase PAP2 family protein [Paraferrimonas sp. SM1919]